MNIQRVLVPVDYSDHSRRALEYAAQLANRFGASLEVLHVWDRPSYVPDNLTVGPPGTAKSLAELVRDTAQAEMTSFLAGVNLRAPVALEHHLVGGEPAHAILDWLRSHPAQLLVVGTHGRTGVKHLLMGSVAEKLVRLSPVPVLTVPPERSSE